MLRGVGSSRSIRKLFQPTRGTGNEKSVVNEIICEAGDTSVGSIQRYFGQWTGLFEKKFGWSVAPTASLRYLSFLVDDDCPPNEAVSKDLSLLNRHRPSGPKDLSQILYEDSGELLAELFENIWETDYTPCSFFLPYYVMCVCVVDSIYMHSRIRTLICN